MKTSYHNLAGGEAPNEREYQAVINDQNIELQKKGALQELIAISKTLERDTRRYAKKVATNLRALLAEGPDESPKPFRLHDALEASEGPMKPTSRGYNSLKTDLVPQSWARLADHDLTYLNFTRAAQTLKMLTFWITKSRGGLPGRSDIRKYVFSGEWEIFLRDILQDMASITDLMPLPHKAMQAAAKLELGEAPHTTPINFFELVQPIARAVQLCFLECDFAITNPSNEQPNRNQIILDIDPDIEITTNKGILFSAILNILTNAVKAIKTKSSINHLQKRITEGKHPENPEKILVRVREEKDGIVVSIEDSGTGFDGKTLIGNIRKGVAAGKITREDLDGYAGDILDKEEVVFDQARLFKIAQLPGVSGFKGDSSGRGLTSIAKLLEKMGWSISADKSQKLDGVHIQITIPDEDLSGIITIRELQQRIAEAHVKLEANASPLQLEDLVRTRVKTAALAQVNANFQTTSPSVPVSSSPVSTPAPTQH